MTVEQRRMYQRRGLQKDLPHTPMDGEIYLTLDTEKMLVGLNGGFLNLITPSEIINNLTTSDANRPLSAEQGVLLNAKIGSEANRIDILQQAVNDFLESNTEVSDDVLADILLLKERLDELEILLGEKQNQFLYSGDEPPTNTNLFWEDTSED